MDENVLAHIGGIISDEGMEMERAVMEGEDRITKIDVEEEGSIKYLIDEIGRGRGREEVRRKERRRSHWPGRSKGGGRGFMGRIRRG